MKMMFFRIMLTCGLFGFSAMAVPSASDQSAGSQSPYLYILGVTQDAGYPQAGCYQAHCMPGWEQPGQRRGAVSLGLIDPAVDRKYMFESTPSFPAQLYELELEAPTQRFEFAGIFLTHAHIGHYAGLMFLGHEAMGASKVPVFAMPVMTDFLKTNGPWKQLVDYQNIVLQPLEHNKVVNLGRLKVTPLLVPHRDEYSETVGFRIDGPARSALFIPDINKWHLWDTDITELVKSVDYALLDASFFADGELPGRDMSKIPHPLVSETMETFRKLSADERAKVWFIHMNHTNPLLNADSAEYKEVIAKGFNIAAEGIRLVL